MINFHTQAEKVDKYPNNLKTGINQNVLNLIHQKDINIAIYQRNINELEDEITKLLNRNIEFKYTGSLEGIEKELKSTLGSKDFNLVIEDVLNLVQCFKQLSDSTESRILLATVNSNMCRKFHTDINTLRLLCTYQGPGTLWVSNEVADSDMFDNQTYNSEIIIEESLINQVRTGHVAILKGALYEDGIPIMHRSPTIEETGDKRLLLRIDLNENLWA